MKAEESMDRALNGVLAGVMGAFGYLCAMRWHDWSGILGFLIVGILYMVRVIYLSGVLSRRDR